MGNIIVINGTNLKDYAWKDLPGGSNSLEILMQASAKLPEITGKWILCPAGDERFSLAEKSGFSLLARDSWTIREFFSALEEVKDQAERIFFLQGNAPLFDPELALEMYRSHTKYFAHYSFADGYPLGLCGEILDTSILTSLAFLAGEEEIPLDEKTLFSLISKDINSFDLETMIAPKDMRMLRVSLTCDTWRNFSLLRTVMERGGRDASSVMDILETSPEILRTFPAYAEIQIGTGLTQKPFYLPDFPGTTLEKAKMRFVAPEDFAVLVSRFADFAGEGVVNLGFRTEPALHPELSILIAEVLKYPGLSVLLETSGLGWDDGLIGKIKALDTRRIDWIVELDAIDPGVYRQTRGDGFEQAMAGTESLFENFPGHVWVQAVRLEETESHMETFYRYWNEKTKNVIIQKYDFFSGRLPQRKVVDLSPLKRLPCWHLKRDLIVLLDGTVVVCKDELENPRTLGNLLRDDLSAIWKRGEELHREQCQGRYPGICGDCDEYYTFNY